jgi:TP901 family phage tail tape measure protein
MSDLPQAGVQLVAPGEAAFKSALAAAVGAVQALGTTSGSTAAQIDKLTDRLTFQQRSLGIMQQELAAVSAKYGEGSTQAQRKQLAVDKLTASIARDEKELAALKSQEEAAAGSSTKLAGELDHAGQASSKMGQVMTGALRQVGTIAVNAFGSAMQALGSFISSSISGAGDYEQSMNVLQSTTSATDQEMQAVKDTAKALGADLTLPATSAASAGDAMLYLTQQGLSLQDSMAAAKGTLQLAAAGMVDEKEAAGTTATALNQFSLAGSDAVRVADLIAASVSASGSSVSQTGQAVQQAGTSFASAHVPLEDFLTLVNEMSKAGIKGSDAGTSLKTMMQRLEAPTAKAAHQMEALGIAVYDQAGAMLPMRDIIGQFSKSLSGLTQKERDQAIVTIFGSDAQRAANIILAGGSDAYDKMRDKVTRAGAAQQLAAAQMQGLKGATAGLQSQLETLALEGLEPLLPIMSGAITEAAKFAGSFVGQVGPAVQGAIVFFAEAGHVIVTIGIPALEGLTAALIAYAAVQTVQAIPAILASIPALVAQTAAFVANALAVAAALAPYALIAAAIAGVAYAYQNLSKANQSATDQLLNSKPFWADNTTALENYGHASEETQAKLKPLADAIAQQRDVLRHNVESLALRMEAGLVSDEQYQKEMATINAEANVIQIQTGQLNEATQAQIKAQAATMSATGQTQAQTAALGDNQKQIQLTEKELEELGKQLEKTFKEGSQAVQDYVSQAASFMDQLTDTSKKANDRITADQAEAYAEQAAAQRAHLGDMLAQYTLAQRQLGNITNEQADVILGAIEKQFGSTDDTASRTFLHMEQAIDRFAQNGGSSAEALAGQLGNLTDDAVTTKEKMDALAKKYTAEIVQNFQQGRIDAEEFRHELERIPQRVNTEIHTNYTESGHPPQHGGQQGDAVGGAIEAGAVHWVGEQGRELFMPSQNGYVIPHDQAMRMVSPPASAQQILGASQGGGAYTQQQTRVYNYSPTYGAAPRAPAVDFATLAAFGS